VSQTYRCNSVLEASLKKGSILSPKLSVVLFILITTHETTEKAQKAKDLRHSRSVRTFLYSTSPGDSNPHLLPTEISP